MSLALVLSPLPLARGYSTLPTRPLRGRAGSGMSRPLLCVSRAPAAMPVLCGRRSACVRATILQGVASPYYICDKLDLPPQNRVRMLSLLSVVYGRGGRLSKVNLTCVRNSRACRTARRRLQASERCCPRARTSPSRATRSPVSQWPRGSSHRRATARFL